MKLINSLKTVCDFLLLISFAAIIPSYGKARLLIVAVLALAFLSSLLIQSIPDILPLKVLCALLPALGLLAANSISQIVLTSIIIFCYVLIVIEDKIEIHYEDYKFWFAVPAVPVIVLFVVTESYWPIRSTATVCAGLYLFLGVLVLRRKRIGTHATFGIKAVNFTELFGVLIANAVLCFITHTTVMALKDVLVALLTPLAIFFHIPVYLLSTFLDFVNTNRDEQRKEEVAKEVHAAGSSNSGSTVRNFHAKTGDELVYMIFVAVVIITIIVLIAWIFYGFWKMLRSVESEAASHAVIEEGQEEPFFFGFNRRRKRKKLASLSNNEKVRQIYTDYLYFMRACGVSIGKESTSEEVMVDSLEFVEPENAIELREIYLRARYNDREDLDDNEVIRAKEIYDHIVESRKNI